MDARGRVAENPPGPEPHASHCPTDFVLRSCFWPCFRGLPVHWRSPQAPAIPTPESVFGFQPGADFRLANYEQVVAYFQRVDEASDRVMLVAGRQEHAGPAVLLRAGVVGGESASSIDRYREIARRLAHPEGLTDAEAQRARARRQGVRPHRRRPALDAKWPAPQHTPQLLYDLVSRADEPEIDGDARQRDPDAVADDQSGRPVDGGRLLHGARRHAERERRA